MALPDQTTTIPHSVWDYPAGAVPNVGWRHLMTLLVTVALGTVVAGLGTLSFPLGDTPSGFAPATAIQVVAGVWFGGWGVLAGLIFPAIVRSLAEPEDLPGRILVDLILSGLPALWFRYSRRDPRLDRRNDRFMYLIVVVLITNVLAGIVGTSYLVLVGQLSWSLRRWLFNVLAWSAAGAGPCLILGLPLLRTLSPVVIRSSLFCRGWWQSQSGLGPTMRRFRHQPIIVKIMLGLGAAGFFPLLFVIAISFWDDYHQARVQAVETQRSLATQIELDLDQILSHHEAVLDRFVERLTRSQTSDPLLERATTFSPLYPSIAAEVQFVPFQSLQESQEIGNEEAKELSNGRTVIVVGTGPLPRRSESVKLMRQVTSGRAAGTVVVSSIGLDELEKALFASARQFKHEYGLFTSNDRHLLGSTRFRRPQTAREEGDFAEAAEGRVLLYHRRALDRPAWKLELMIPQASGVKGALAQRHNYTAVIASLALFGAVVVGGRLARALEQPIRDLTRTVRQSGRLDADVEAAVHGHDEIGELASSFNEMSRQLRRSIAALERTTAEKERLSYEFELAAELQRRILPAWPPNTPGFEIAGLSEPAREVGGDFFDWPLLSDIRLGLLIGDACGKGMAAAFLVNESRSVVRAHLQDTPSAGAALRRTNHTLYYSRTLDDVFTTMFCMILTVPSRRLDYASAGHPSPILYRPTTDELHYLDAVGRPLGLEPENPIEDATINLAPGDVLVAFTDGVIDATSPAGDRFGRSRLVQLVREHHSLPARDLAQRLKQEVVEFCETAPQFDDMTLLVLRATLTGF